MNRTSRPTLTRFKAELRDRIAATVEWYATGAVVCPETIAAIEHDLSSVLDETRRRYGFAPPSFRLKVWGGSDGMFVIRCVRNVAN